MRLSGSSRPLAPFFCLAVAIAITALGSWPVFGADSNTPPPPPPPGKRIHHTYPQPPRARPNDPLRVNPGWDVPEHPERYIWRLSGKLPDGKIANPPVVPVYTFVSGTRIKVGELPVGAPITLGSVRARSGNLYYAVTLPGAKPGTDKSALTWISGLAIEPVSYSPVVQ